MKIITANTQPVNQNQVVDMYTALKTGEAKLGKDGIRFDKKSSVVAGLENGAALDFADLIKWASKPYNISDDPRDYAVVPVPIMVSDVPNRNGVAFPAKALAEFSIELGMPFFKSWKGKPTFEEHCFPASAPIITKKGYAKLGSIKVGDKVLTHNLRFKRVTQVFKNGEKWLTRIKATGLAEDILATETHPMWVVDGRQIYTSRSNVNTKTGRLSMSGFNRPTDFADLKPHWRPVSDLYVGDYLVVPNSIGGSLTVPKEFAFLTGIFMAEGSFEKHKGEVAAVFLTFGRSESVLIEHTEECCHALGLKVTRHWHKKNNTCLLRIAGREFASKMLRLCGDYAHLKTMRKELLKWDDNSLNTFLGAYIAGDGHVKGGYIRCRTASYRLSQDIQRVAAKLGYKSFVNHDSHPCTHTYYSEAYQVERTYESKGSYCVKIVDNDGKLDEHVVGKTVQPAYQGERDRDMIIPLGDYMLVPVVSIEHKVSFEKVFNIEVEDDHTYVAYGVVVHNCNKDVTKAKGIILDSVMNKVSSRPGFYKVVNLLAFDRTKDRLCYEKIVNGSSNAYSMGAYSGYYKCSLCGNAYNPGEKPMCSHLHANKVNFYEVNGRMAYAEVWQPIGFETSRVDVPAYRMAVSDNVSIMDPQLRDKKP